MAHLDPNSTFQSWILTPEELVAGTILSIGQRQVIQNQTAQIALQKLALKFDSVNPIAYAQEEAYLRGQIDALSYLLTGSDDAVRQTNPGQQQVHFSGF